MPPPSPAPVPARTATTLRLADYLVLTKPRISVLVLLTVSAGLRPGIGGPLAGNAAALRPHRHRPRGRRFQRLQPAPRTRQRRPDAADGQSPASRRPALGPRGAAVRPCLPGFSASSGWRCSSTRRRRCSRASRWCCTPASTPPSNAARRSARPSGPFRGASAGAGLGGDRRAARHFEPSACLRSSSSGSFRTSWRSPGSTAANTPRRSEDAPRSRPAAARHRAHGGGLRRGARSR